MAPKRAILAQGHLAQVGIASDAAEDDVLILGGSGGRGLGLAAILGDPLLGLFGIAVIDRNLMAALCRWPAIG